MSNDFLSNQMQIGKRLREFRLSKGMKAVDFARICGISQGSLSGLENGKSYPSAETLINLLRYTDINVKWLLTGVTQEDSVKGLDCTIKYAILNEVDEWLDQQVQKNPNRKAWFELNLLDTFPAFKTWRDERSAILDENTEMQRQATGGGER